MVLYKIVISNNTAGITLHPLTLADTITRRYFLYNNVTTTVLAQDYIEGDLSNYVFQVGVSIYVFGAFSITILAFS